MKKLITVNYWIMSVAWSLCISERNAVGVIMALAATIVLSALRKGVNYWRVLANALLTVMAVMPLYYLSNIHYFFENLGVLLVIAGFNSAFANEYLCRYKTRYMSPYVLTLLLSGITLALIIVVLPANEYSLFTKQSLYIMNGFIFLPYLLRPAICIVLRALRKNYHSSLQVNAVSR